uniref:Uncharacterized protein n=1 Tax=Arundo donax TaxID=35708 RepID=A0A0A9BKL5_ARUDO
MTFCTLPPISNSHCSHCFILLSSPLRLPVPIAWMPPWKATRAHRLGAEAMLMCLVFSSLLVDGGKCWSILQTPLGIEAASSIRAQITR